MTRMFQVFGHEKVWVLDGGLPRWRTSGYDVESSASSDAILKASASNEAIEKVYQGQTVSSLLTYILCTCIIFLSSLLTYIHMYIHYIFKK